MSNQERHPEKMWVIESRSKAERIKVWTVSKGSFGVEAAMPGPYSNDLRSRVLQACDEGERPSSVAKRFRVGRASVYLWLKQRREEGGDCPKKMGGGPQPVIRDAAEATLKRLVESDNHLTLAQYRDKLADETGTRVHPWTVGRALRRLRLTRKKEDPTRRRAGRGCDRPSPTGLAHRA